MLLTFFAMTRPVLVSRTRSTEPPVPSPSRLINSSPEGSIGSRISPLLSKLSSAPLPLLTLSRLLLPSSGVDEPDGAERSPKSLARGLDGVPMLNPFKADRSSSSEFVAEPLREELMELTFEFALDLDRMDGLGELTPPYRDTASLSAAVIASSSSTPAPLALNPLFHIPYP